MTSELRALARLVELAKKVPGASDLQIREDASILAEMASRLSRLGEDRDARARRIVAEIDRRRDAEERRP
jgi:hypothetical protein